MCAVAFDVPSQRLPFFAGGQVLVSSDPPVRRHAICSPLCQIPMSRLLNVLLAYLIILISCIPSARAADADNGKAVFKRCAACHSLEPNKNDDAPTLAGIFGRRAACEDYRYSSAMKRSNIVWDRKNLDAFLEDPQAFIPGNRMPFDGVKDKSDRDDLLEYLKQATKIPHTSQDCAHGPSLRNSYVAQLLLLAKIPAAPEPAARCNRGSAINAKPLGSA